MKTTSTVCMYDMPVIYLYVSRFLFFSCLFCFAIFFFFLRREQTVNTDFSCIRCRVHSGKQLPFSAGNFAESLVFTKDVTRQRKLQVKSQVK